MLSIKTILIVAGIGYYIYSSIKGKEAQKNKKTVANPTPSQKSSLDELLEKMLEQQQGRTSTPAPPPVIAQEPYKPKPIMQPKSIMKPKAKPLANQKQGLPFEKRKSSDVREMPSRKQIEKVIIREKKATEAPVIKVKDYDIDIVNHDKPHPTHHLADQSKIKFHFKEEEPEQFEFDARQAIISQVILERKEF